MACGKELRDGDTLQKIVLPPGAPKNVHVSVNKIVIGAGLPRNLDDPGLSKNTHRQCCDECVLW